MGKKASLEFDLSSNSIILKEIIKKDQKEKSQKQKKQNKKNKSFYKKKKKQIRKIIIEGSETLGYRSFEGKFDNLRPITQSGEKYRSEILRRYRGLRPNAAAAVAAAAKIRSDNSVKNRKPHKKIRDKLSSGLCDICNIRMTRYTERTKGRITPWHRETLEHVLDHDLGGSLKKSELAVICLACNQALATQKPILPNGILNDEAINAFKKEIYDFFIFKQVLLISQDAAARDFNSKFLKFWEYRRNLANNLHKKAVSQIQDQKVRIEQKETVYWTLDCFNHSHCRECGACNCTSLSHDSGHNITYVMD